MNAEAHLVLAVLLFAVGAFGLLLRRNVVIALMSMGLMLNATNLMFVTFTRQHDRLDDQVTSSFVMVVAVARIVVDLTITIAIYRARRSASVDDVNLLKF